MLLVGGKGTRLGELTRTKPKPLMGIDDDRVFLDFLIENVARQGYGRITLLAGFHGDQIGERYSGRTVRGARLEVLVEPEPLGTGGAVRFARDLLDERFLLSNGDTYFDLSYRGLEAAWAGATTAGVIALRNVDDAGRYGSVRLAGDRITAFEEKGQDASCKPGVINAGVYLLSKSVVDELPAGGSISLETDVFPGLAAAGRLIGLKRDGYFIDIGLPETLGQARRELPALATRPALFLDRDGVINLDHGYVHRWAEFDFVEGAAELIRAYNEAGYLVFVVTNQAGVAHGFYGEADIQCLHEQVSDALARHGAHVDRFYYCPYHPEAAIEAYRMDHVDRKPGPGMLLRAMADWSIDRRRSLLIGDRDTDLAAAAAAGVRAVKFAGRDLYRFCGEAGLWPSG